MGAEPAGWALCLLAAAFEGAHLIVHEHQIDAIPRLSAINLKKARASFDARAFYCSCRLTE